MATMATMDDDCSEESEPYSPSTPYVIDVDYDNGSTYEYEPILKEPTQEFGPSFQLPLSVNATPAALCELFLPDSLLDKWVSSTNHYAASYLSIEKRRDITRMDIFRFLSAVSYMGLVRLPAKGDYFSKDNSILPHHHAITINRSMFEYLWRNFHTSYKSGTGVLDEVRRRSSRRRRSRRRCNKSNISSLNFFSRTTIVDRGNNNIETTDDNYHPLHGKRPF